MVLSLDRRIISQKPNAIPALMRARRERPRGRRAAEQGDEMPAPHLITSPQNTFSISAIRRKDDAEQHTLVHAFLFGSTDMSTAIRRDDIIDLVTRNRHPSAVYLHCVVVSNHTTLGRPTIH